MGRHPTLPKYGAIMRSKRDDWLNRILQWVNRLSWTKSDVSTRAEGTILQHMTNYSLRLQILLLLQTRKIYVFVILNIYEKYLCTNIIRHCHFILLNSVKTNTNIQLWTLRSLFEEA